MKTNARKLRKSLTEAEKKLWYYLRGRNFETLKFRRQYWLASYIVDFICLEKKLIIELDGSQHQEEMQSAYDLKRTKNLEKLGFQVLRFWNTDVLLRTNSVLEAINHYIHPHPNPLPPAGEGIQ